MLHRITGRAVKCGPSTISAIASVPTHKAAAVIRRLFDRPSVNGVYTGELAAALEQFSFVPDYAMRHPKYRERRYARREQVWDRIAHELQAAQRRNFYQVQASIRQRGHYCHEHTMTIEVERDSPTWQPMTDGAEDTVIEALRDLTRWLYRQLRQEYQHLTSDAAIDGIVAANQWTFTADGERFG